MEIERTVQKYRASGFISGWQGNQAFIAFEMSSRRVKFTLPLPDPSDEKFTQRVDGRTGRPSVRTPEAARAAWEQACRQRWRALALAVKAKLEAVEAGIATFEEEFLAYICLPDGKTVGESAIPNLREIYGTGRMQPLLPA